MIEIGYALSSEEHSPEALVNNARAAEASGFSFALISDHFHPWVSRQGNSPFVWSVLGAIACATQRIRIGTGVTCPIIRIHPAIIAQAASTAAAMLPGRFFLGVGTGEYLNEHILGDPWPEAETRLDMLAEAVVIIKDLWRGESFTHIGKYFAVKDARIYTRPAQPPPIYMAASGDESAELAGKIADGLISTVTGSGPIAVFKRSGGCGKPTIGMLKVCWAENEADAEQTVRYWWPASALSGKLHVDLSTPEHFEDVIELWDQPVIPDDTVLGPDPELYLDAISALAASGYSHIYLHQIGPDQMGFFQFFREILKPELAEHGFVDGVH